MGNRSRIIREGRRRPGCGRTAGSANKRLILAGYLVVMPAFLNPGRGRGEGLAWSTATCRGIAAAVLAASSLVFAQTAPKPAVEEPRFDIRRFVFEGATLIPLEQLEASTAAFTGKN